MGMGHGWVKPLRGGAKARCGGPGICPDCQREYRETYGRDFDGPAVNEIDPKTMPAEDILRLAVAILNQKFTQSVVVAKGENESHVFGNFGSAELTAEVLAAAVKQIQAQPEETRH